MLAFTALGLFAGASIASASWNNDPLDRATVRVMNNSINGNVSTCWSTTIPGTNNGCTNPIMQPGQVVSVAVYYHNTGTQAENAIIRINTPSTMGASASHVISGGVNGTNGSATINISSAQTLTFIPGTARWYPNQSANETPLPNGQNGSELFGSGLSVGSIAPGWGTQGSVVFHMRVGQTVQQTYACNDNIDNDGDGLIDMNDSGCTSQTDTDEYNYVQPPAYACNDGYDNDGDGRIDMNDPGCSSTYDTDEYNYVQPTTYACNDGYDNDSDGRIDMNDPGCSSIYDTDEYNYVQPITYACNDNIDNDGDGRIDMNDSGCSSIYDTDEYNYIQQQVAPDVTTIPATFVGNSSARLNGAVTFASNGIQTTAWFEYGTTQNMGSTTATQIVTTQPVACVTTPCTTLPVYYQTVSFSQSATSLSPNTIYYFRAVAQNSSGTDYGQVLSFTTGSVPVVIPVQPGPTVIYTGGGSGSNLVMLKITPDYENVNVGDVVNYLVEYKNISGRTLDNVIIRVILPQEILFKKSTTGIFSTDNGLTVELGTLVRNQEGKFSLQGEILVGAKNRDLLVTTAHMVFTDSRTTAQEDALAYAMNTVAGRNNSLLAGLALFGADGILPNTLLGWLILILIILAIVLLVRKAYEKKPMITPPPTGLPM